MVVAVYSYFVSAIVVRKMSKDPLHDSILIIRIIVIASIASSSANCINPQKVSSIVLAY